MGITAAAEAASKSSSNSSLTILIPLILLFAGIYFLVFRPQRRRQQAVMQKQNTIAPGSRVRTIGGMYADVVEVDGDDLILEIAPDVEVRFHKRAIAEVISSGEEVAEEPADSEYEEDDAESAEDGLADSHEDDLSDSDSLPADHDVASANGTKAKSDSDVF